MLLFPPPDRRWLAFDGSYIGRDPMRCNHGFAIQKTSRVRIRVCIVGRKIHKRVLGLAGHWRIVWVRFCIISTCPKARDGKAFRIAQNYVIYYKLYCK
jgi:hypothetical protein